MNSSEEKQTEIKKVAILLLNFNLPEMTDRLVEQIERNTKFPHTLFLLDNGSEAGKRSKYATHVLEKNIGLNKGIEYLWQLVKDQKQFDAFWWLCNDIVLDEERDYLEEMARVYENEVRKAPVACITPSYHWRTKEEAVMAPGNMRSKNNSPIPRRAVHIEWNAILVTRTYMEVFFKDGFGLNTKHAFHDTLVSYTAWKHGFQCLIMDNLSIVHVGNQSFLQNGGKIVNGIHIPNIQGLQEMLVNDMNIFAEQFKNRGIDVLSERKVMHEDIDLLKKYNSYIDKKQPLQRNFFDTFKLLLLKIKSRYV